MTKFKKTSLAVVILATVSMTGCQTTQSSRNSLDSSVVDVSDRVVSMKRGVLLMADHVQVTNKQLEDQQKSLAGGVMGAGAATAAYGGLSGNRNAAAIGGAVALVGLVGMAAQSMSDSKKIDAIRYTVEYQNGGMIEAFQIDDNPIMVGSPVFVRQFRSGKLNISLDTTAGVQFQRAQKTNYAGDAEKQAKADAEAARIAAEKEEDRQFAREHARRRIEANTSTQETIADKVGDTIDARNEAVRGSNERTININATGL
ncbi:acetate kinase [Vibrio sp. SCSIO 43140]|uniref:acetate kinase n=1 Tax=Vibrio sp. SCSIO 43140 TaxID=2819100 RepID=UPI0020750E2C|nr:acetate kinase [Vibrio sp. SCSIO 43140]USD58797.1 acetate kinase [Vibrio sp. SCSIO 43140]USD59131.1 acetate kinase [Vibrio sp. SCSIO 43140]USD59716.1 acetate kinase [Vibrio sp. SCSIO 43140]